MHNQNIASEWTMNYQKHIKQNDTHNCGVYIVYFFRQICANDSLEKHVDPNQFRIELSTLLLVNSDDIKNRCIYCGRSHPNEYILTCASCGRFAHERNGCANADEFRHGICYLCQNY